MFYGKKSFSILFNRICNNYFPGKNYTIYHFCLYDFDNMSKVSTFKKFMSNFIYTDQDKQKYMEIYSKTFILYRVFTRFYQNHVKRKMTKSPFNANIMLTPLTEFKDIQKFDFVHENTLYTFTVQDLLKIIKNSLLSHDRFFLSPNYPKNPYNNLNFTETSLYNFYFFLLQNNYTVPELFRRFFYSNFNTEIFLRKNEHFIRELIIDNYANQLTCNELYEEIILFLRSIKLQGLFIHIDYPKKYVIDKFNDVITCFWHSNYNLSSEMRKYNFNKMNYKLMDILEDITTFGRVILKRNYKKKDYPHIHYKITNLLDQTIPNYDSLKDVISFMEKGQAQINTLDSDSDENDEINFVDVQNAYDDDGEIYSSDDSIMEID